MQRVLKVAIVSVLAYLAVLVALLAIGSVVTVPDEDKAMTPADGGLGAVTHQLLGRHGGTDFLVDYVGAKGLLHDQDAYSPIVDLTTHFGESWAIGTANPHPPTLLPIVLPFAMVRYPWALAAWSLAMIVAYAATVRLAGASWLVSSVAAVALAATFPGAYGIGNPVPLIALGAVLAFRYRHDPLVASIGLALAAAPKTSGILLVVPFLLARRWRTVALTAGWLGVLAIIPMALQRNVWSRYLDLGVQAARDNADRNDNGSLFKLADKWGLPSITVVVVVGLAVVVLALVRRELFTPIIWATVAGLPIAWMYSLLTLMPLAVVYLLRGRTEVRLWTVAAITLMVSSPPSSQWPVVMFPTVLVLVYVAALRHDGPFAPDEGPVRDAGTAAVDAAVGALPSWIPRLPSRVAAGGGH